MKELFQVAKRYIVTEDSGCGCGGCGTIFAFLILGSILISIAPYLLAGLVVILIIVGIIYYPKYKENKQRKKQEAEFAERERQIEIELRKRELEKREKEVFGHKNSDDVDNWEDF